ncbi:MAG: alpha/beta family hydrolase [Planctomycetaceae bacterium]
MATRKSATIDLGEEVVVGPHKLPGILSLPERPCGVVLFAHGSGSSRLSERNQYVARILQEAGIATLLFDLLTEAESDDRRNVFDIGLLAERLQEASEWLKSRPDIAGLRLGYFGASTGAAAALVAAARHAEGIAAVVSRGGRPDLAMDDLPSVRAATLLIVGEDDEPVVQMNREAFATLECEKEMELIHGATHLFPEPGALEKVARLARQWFVTHLRQQRQAGRGRATLEPQVSSDPDPLFRDREDAGRQLAKRLKELELHDPLVLGIPRGGVATGAVLARELNADLDIVLARKLRAPMQPELAIGSVSEDGHVYLTPEARTIPGVTDEYIAREREYQINEIERRTTLFRSVRPAARFAGRSIILTDDGIATGSTMLAALDVIKAHEPYEVIVAAPVAPPDRLEPIRQKCDRLICLHTPALFWAIGQFYADFRQVEDDEVVNLLREFAPATP